jgi:hypothetical protein
VSLLIGAFDATNLERVFLSDYHAVSDGRSDFVHCFDIQADSVRIEAAVLVLYP